MSDHSLFKILNRVIVMLLTLLTGSGICSIQAQQTHSFDVAIFGATPSGIAAAVSAARQGASVAIVEESSHIGGLVTGGMSNPDFKSFESLSGFYREFMDRVLSFYVRTYGTDSPQVKDCFWGVWYEPKVAMKIFRDMIGEQKTIRVFTLYELQKIELAAKGKQQMIKSITFARGKDAIKIAASVFIDATYEGDLMAKAGCSYRVGRESRKEFGELFAGVKYYNNGKFLIGSSGEGDHKIQCYNFRLCMTDVPENRVAITKPDSYNRNEFLPLLEFIRTGKIKGFLKELVGVNRIPNGKADINDLMYSLYSLRLPGENYEWPEGDKRVRGRIFDRHKQYTLSFLYFIQNDPEVPENIRKDALEWGLARDEFEEYGHFSPVLYVREGRRLESRFMLTSHDLAPAPNSVRAPLYTDAIAICDYSMDSHGNAPPIAMHPGITEGVFNAFVVPYQIPFRVMLPKEVSNLLVSCAVSASHVAFSSLRMEPTWCALGQAAGIAAALAVKAGVSFSELDIVQLQKKLHQEAAMTCYVSDIPPGSPYFEAVQFFGTRGAFHDLPEYKGSPYIGRGKGVGRGQFIEKYPYHDIHPDQKMDASLARQWHALAGLKEQTVAFDNISRAEFLLALYQKIK